MGPTSASSDSLSTAAHSCSSLLCRGHPARHRRTHTARVVAFEPRNGHACQRVHSAGAGAVQPACMQFGCVQAPTAPFMAFVLEPLIDGGFLRAFHCDLDLTRHALYHERVCRVHITGSDRTHDVIAWGTGVRGRPPPLCRPARALLWRRSRLDARRDRALRSSQLRLCEDVWEPRGAARRHASGQWVWRKWTAGARSKRRRRVGASTC